MSHLRRAMLMLSLSCLLGGCSNGFSYKDLFFVEVEEKRMCKSLGEHVIPPAAPGVHEMNRVIPFSSLPSDLSGEAVGQLSIQFTEFTLEADDNTRLDLLEEALLAMRPEGATDLSQATRVLSYQRQSGTNGQPLRLQGEEVDLAQLSASGPMELVLQAKGELPNEQWTLRAQACWAMKVRVNYLHLLSSP